MQIQRTIKVQLHRLVDKVNLLKTILKQANQLTQHCSAVRQGVEIVQHFFTVPILCSLTPNGDVEHLQHPLFRVCQGSKIHVVQSRQNIQKEQDPTPGVNHRKPCECLRQCVFQWLGKVLDYVGSGADTRKRRELIDCPGVQVIVVQEICQS